jgi:hypothetical protein
MVSRGPHRRVTTDLKAEARAPLHHSSRLNSPAGSHVSGRRPQCKLIRAAKAGNSFSHPLANVGLPSGNSSFQQAPSLHTPNAASSPSSASVTEQIGVIWIRRIDCDLASASAIVGPRGPGKLADRVAHPFDDVILDKASLTGRDAPTTGMMPVCGLLSKASGLIRVDPAPRRTTRSRDHRPLFGRAF